MLGDTTSFFLGRRLGRDFILRHGPKVKIDEERLGQVESYFERHGGKTILIGRFIGLVRALAPFVAGLVGPLLSPLRARSASSAAGCGPRIFSVLGFVFYRSFDRVADDRREGHVRVRGHGRGDRGRGVRVPAAAPRGGPPPAGRLDRGPAASCGPIYRRGRGAGRARGRPAAAVPGRPAHARASSGSSSRPTLAIAGVGHLRVHALHRDPVERRSRDHARRPRAARPRRRAPARASRVDVAKVVTDLGAFPTVAALLVGVGVRARGAPALRRARCAAWPARSLIYVGRPADQGGSRPAAAGRSAGATPRARASRAGTRPTPRSGSAWRWWPRACSPGWPAGRAGGRRSGDRRRGGPVADLPARPLLVRRRGRLGPRGRGARQRARPSRSSSRTSATMATQEMDATAPP